MGLDTVELVMQVEETFQLEIPDRDAEQLVTVGQLYEYVRRRVPRDGACVTRHVFYRLRAALRVRCRPDEILESLVPANDRPRAWTRLASKAVLQIPALRRPEWVFTTGVTICALGAVGALVAALGATEFHPGGTVCVAIASIATYVLWLVTIPLALHFPPRCETVGDLARTVAIANASELRIMPGWSDMEVWRTVQRIIAEQLGVPLEQVTPEKEFIRDLGMG